MNAVYKISFIVLLLIGSLGVGWAQEDTAKAYLTDPDIKTKNKIILKTNKVKKDSLKVYVKKDKPDNFVQSVLYYLSPKKYVETFIKPTDLNPITRKDSADAIQQSAQAYQFNQTKNKNFRSEAEWSKTFDYKATPYGDTTNVLRSMVYGYHPYWVGSAYESYNFKLLSRIAYFCYFLDPKTGTYKSIYNWKNSKLIQLAHKHGTKVDLCITNFGLENNTLFLSNPDAQNTMIDSVIALIRNADGINIDFEDVPKASKDNFTLFIKKLSKAMKKANKNHKLTIALPSVDWTKSFDVKALDDFTDYFFIMGYDYYGVHSKVAGPNSLIFSGSNWTKHNINSTVNYYLNEGLPKEKIILGISYCYKEWETVSNEIASETKQFIDTKSYREVTSRYAEKYMSYFDTASFSSYFIFREGNTWKQLWGDDENSLAKKYDYIQGKELGGVGIWALGYDNGFSSLWELLAKKFSITKQEYDSLKNIVPVAEKNISTIVEDQMAKNAIQGVEGTTNLFINQTKSGLSSYIKVISLALVILVCFLVVGFIVAIVDYDVRLSLFSTETKVYFFFLLLLTMFVIFLRVTNSIKYIEMLFIIGVGVGTFIGLIIFNVLKIKKNKRAELTP